jgi:hypothetical protein
MTKSLLWPVEPIPLPRAATVVPPEKRAVCKLAGSLVVATFSQAPDGLGRCPCCHGTKFREEAGWIACADCDNFAILKTDLEKMQA